MSMKIRTYVEVWEDGEVVDRKAICEADRIVALTFSDKKDAMNAGIGKYVTEAGCTVIGEFNALSVADLAVATAKALHNIIRGSRHAPQLLELFTNSMNDALTKTAYKETDCIKQDIKMDFKKHGYSDSFADMFLKVAEKAFEESEWGGNNGSDGKNK